MSWPTSWISAGFDVTREYYINDAGAQVDVLARSAFHFATVKRIGEAVGAMPEGYYPGDYLKPVGAALAVEYGDRLLAMPESEWLPVVRQRDDPCDDAGDSRGSGATQYSP